MQGSFVKATNKSKGIRDDNTWHGCRRVNIMLLHLNYYRDYKKIHASLFTSNTMGNALSFSNNMPSFQVGIHPKTLMDSLDILYVPHFSLFKGIDSRNIINYGSRLSLKNVCNFSHVLVSIATYITHIRPIFEETKQCVETHFILI